MASRSPARCIRRSATSSRVSSPRNNAGVMCAAAGFCKSRSSRNSSGPSMSSPAMRGRPSRISRTGRRDNFRSRASASTSAMDVCVSMVTVCASGVAIWRTVKVCKSSTRLIIARSSVVNTCADSCMTASISSRLPNSRPVSARPPVQRNTSLDTSSTITTSGPSMKWMGRKGFAANRHS